MARSLFWAKKPILKRTILLLSTHCWASRSDLKGSLAPILKRLTQVDFTKLDKTGKLALLRTYGVAMSRGSRPDKTLVKAVGSHLDPHFPAEDDNLNEELCRVLSYLQHPSVLDKTVADEGY